MATETEQIVIPLQDPVPATSLQTPPFAASPIRLNYVESQNLQRNDNYPTSSEELAATALPPVDRGFKAWSFIAAAFVLEILVWGLGFSYVLVSCLFRGKSWLSYVRDDRYGVFQEYYISHTTFGNASEAAIGAVGTTTLAIGYFECLVIILVAQHWPDKIRGLMWSSLALCCSSLALASFATQIWHLQLLQGICFGIGCGGLYAPVLVYLSEWFSAKRGLAGSIIFGGSGIGGAVFPVTTNFLLQRFGFRWTLRLFSLAILVLGAIALMFTRPRLPVTRASRADGVGFIARIRRQ
ncbi:hypothetical protein FRC09_001427, partial [Ceratobasidium sp. 395]